MELTEAQDSFLLAQRYIENTGFDIKLYVIGMEVYAVAKKSPLHPDVQVKKRLIPVTLELYTLALDVGQLFGLDIYGLDVVETAQGPVIVDINDFPSFGRVPGAVARVSTYILHVAKRIQLQRVTHMKTLKGSHHEIVMQVPVS